MAEKVPGNMPAWMVAQALVIKAKNACIEEAIDLLYKEIESKRMAISGSFMPMDVEKSGEMEQGLFLIRHLIDEKQNILEDLSLQITQLESKNDISPEDIEKMEAAKKFMLSIEQITSFVEYGMIFEEWFNDVSMQIKETDPSTILAKTSKTGSEGRRAESIRFLVKSKLFRGSLFTKEEKECLKNALELISAAKAT